MGTKNSPGEFDCYANADPDEPMFILLGRDNDAPNLVRAWACKRALAITGGHKPESDWPMVFEAIQCARAMEDYRRQRVAGAPAESAAS